MAHTQKPDFVFRRNGRVHLNRLGHQFSQLLAPEVCASAVVMLDTPCSEVVCRVLATHSIRQFPLHFPPRASPCAITFQLNSASLKPPTQPPPSADLPQRKTESGIITERVAAQGLRNLEMRRAMEGAFNTITSRILQHVCHTAALYYVFGHTTVYIRIHMLYSDSR